MADVMPPGVQEFLEGVSAFQVVIWIGVAVAVVVGIYKAWPVLRRFVNTVDALNGLPEFMERIRHQVENDHETNLRDEVTQILDEISKLAAWQEHHEKQSEEAINRIGALEWREGTKHL